MTEIIMNSFSAVVSFIAFCVIYVFAVSGPMSHLLLSPTYKKHTPTDKGIGKYQFPNGKGVTFEPDEKYRKYLKKYVLFVYGDQKYIKCKLSGDVLSLRYEVAAYDYKSRLIKVLELAENVAAGSQTQTVRVPDDTAYVSVILRSVNERERFSTLRRTSFVKICVFSFLTVAMTVACGLLARTAILSISELLDFRWDISLGANLILSTIIGAHVVFLYLVINRKQVFGGRS